MPRKRAVNPVPPIVDLDTQLSYDRISEVADERILAAGQELYRRGTVSHLAVNGNRATAAVQGTEVCHVTLTAAEDGPQYDCSSADCAENGEFCEHCAAVAFAYQSEHLGVQTVSLPSRRTAVQKPRRNKAATVDDLRLYLQEREPHELIALILDRAQVDMEWRKSLLLTVAAGSPSASGADIPTLRKAILSATKQRGTLDAAKMRVYLRQIQEIADVLQQLSDRGEQAAVRQLAAYAVELLIEKRDNAYDSGGKLADFIQKLVGFHRHACIESPPDPAELARYLYEREKLDRHGFWSEPMEQYAAALGPDGLAEFRRLLHEEWAAIPPLLPGAPQPYYSFNTRRRHLTEWMESLARSDNDTDALISVLERDLSKPEQFLWIAMICQEAGRESDAIRWAERGIASFDANADPNLTGFLSAEYGRRGENEKALALLWNGFETRPSVDGYRALHDFSHPRGVWADWRAKALTLVRDNMALEKAAPKPTYHNEVRETAGTLLVAIHLWEGETETAWEVAQKDGCNDPLWLKLAETREPRHPDDALHVYRRLVSHLLNISSGSLDSIVSLVQRIKDLLTREGRSEEYTTYITELRTTFRRKRNLMLLLDEYRL